jgi:hypothetical protein
MQDMKNMWDVVHRLIDGEPMTNAEKATAHSLTEVHLAQHLGIARTQGEHREKLREHEEALKGLSAKAESGGLSVAAIEDGD